MEPVFNYTSYKAYIKDFIKGQAKVRGIRSRVCEAVEIHNAYLSQVLNGEKNLSLEQLERFGSFANFTEPELSFFLALAQANRAGTKSLENFFKKRMSELRDLHLNLVDRIGHQKKISERDQATYYSSWHYAAIHTALLVPSLRSVHSLAKRFNISETKVIKVLSFLQTAGVIERDGQSFISNERWVRLPKASPLITQHHSNVRLKAAESIHAQDDQGLHYSGFFAFSDQDFLVLQDLWLKTLKETQKIIVPSPSQSVYSLCMDIFEVS